MPPRTANLAAAGAQIGRPLTTIGPMTVNLLVGGQAYGPRIRQWDFAAQAIFRFGAPRVAVGVDAPGFNPTFAPGVAGCQSPTTYMNPRIIRLNAEFSF